MTTIIRLAIITMVFAALRALAQESKSAALTPEERKLAAEAVQLDREVGQLFQRGQAAEAIAKAREALKIRQQLYPASKYPDGHPDVAAGFYDLLIRR